MLGMAHLGMAVGTDINLPATILLSWGLKGTLSDGEVTGESLPDAHDSGRATQLGGYGWEDKNIACLHEGMLKRESRGITVKHVLGGNARGAKPRARHVRASAFRRVLA